VSGASAVNTPNASIDVDPWTVYEETFIDIVCLLVTVFGFLD